ncbi:MAG: TonB-dependent receptor [Mucilaginibacter polytrichastri]|nr:TonB-dependent receptor [Mucilaginibacter polytrichastri]
MKRSGLILLFLTQVAFAQSRFRAVVEDLKSHEKLAGVALKIRGTMTGTSSDSSGKLVLDGVPDGKQVLQFTFVGYVTREITLTFPRTDTLLHITLTPAEDQLDEVIVTSTRTNSRIENLPVKVEVLGSEEMEEENQVKPASVASILGDLSVIHIQQTSAVTGNTTIRMEGLDGKYTQLLRDGLPLYDGFSGNFGILSIPPLDLKQIEIIKGSVSTLYGGGAIAGMINFISKTPAKEPELSLTLNRSTLKENNLNAYYTNTFGRLGMTVLAQQTLQSAVDVNRDGFSDVARVQNTLFHPRFFYTIHENTRVDAGYSYTYEDRLGGDMRAASGAPDVYFERNRSDRQTADFHIQYNPDTLYRLSVKGSYSAYNQRGSEPGFFLSGRQTSNYVEANNLIRSGKHEIVLGGNYTGEYFRKKATTGTYFGDYTFHTLGAFAQDGWQVAKGLLIETGLRTDHHNVFGWFVLPRIAFFYHPDNDLAIRLSAGSGYKAPALFTSETLSGSLQRLLPLESGIKSERSKGVNFDVNYHFTIGEKLSVNIDQALYYTHIGNPIIAVVHPDQTLSLNNAPFHIRSAGTDTYIRMHYDALELYLGYNHTISRQNGTGRKVYLPFSPQDKASATIAYDIEGKWRFGIEASYIANQYINENERVRNYLFSAAAVERKFGPHFSLVLNGENLGDFRQSRFSPIVSGATDNPQFAALWAPIDGRVINMALRVKL